MNSFKDIRRISIEILLAVACGLVIAIAIVIAVANV